MCHTALYFDQTDAADALPDAVCDPKRATSFLSFASDGTLTHTSDSPDAFHVSISYGHSVSVSPSTAKNARSE